MMAKFQDHTTSGTTRFEALRLVATEWHVQSDLETDDGEQLPPLLEDRRASASGTVCVSLFWAARRPEDFWSARFGSWPSLRQRASPSLDHLCCKYFCPQQDGCVILQTMKRLCSSPPSPNPTPPPSPTGEDEDEDTVAQPQNYVVLTYDEQIDLHVDFTVMQILTLTHLRLLRILSIRAAHLILARLLAFWTLEGVTHYGCVELKVGVVYKLKRSAADSACVFLWVGRHPSYNFYKPHSAARRDACRDDIDRSYANLEAVLSELPSLRHNSNCTKVDE
jgi:hypothetical protein